MGVACATFPTSSSFCMIFLMRALECGEKVDSERRNAFSLTDWISRRSRKTYHGELCRLVSIFHDDIG